MIITPQRNAKIISQQLRQIDASHGSCKRTLLDYTKQFNILKRDPPKSIIERLKSFDFKFEENPHYELVLTSIRVPPDMIDTIADKKGVTANLSHMDSDLQVKTAFKKEFKDSFNMFDSRERVEAILMILEQEIDFENFVQ